APPAEEEKKEGEEAPAAEAASSESSAPEAAAAGAEEKKPEEEASAESEAPAGEAEEKVAFFTNKRTSYPEFQRPANALREVAEPATRVLFTSDFEFSDPGAMSKDFPEAAFTFKAANEQPNVPRGRFELFTVILGKGENQKEFFFKAEDGIPDQKLSWDDGTCIYQVAFEEVNATTAYIQDVYGEGSRPSPLFTRIKTSIVIQRKQ
ncbi:MAG TPA: hypothetical protein PKO06_07920, partial [Candidatus Ozemobacteraceae bacterium]|nr:hypothetical protein [Candidatus Ozemobacteraceae bacterium]